MPLYYFHLTDGDTILDEDGSKFPDLPAVKAEAVRISGEMLRSMNHGANFWSGAPWRLWVTDRPDGEGETFLRLEFTAK